MWKYLPALSEEIAHPTVYHNLSQLSVEDWEDSGSKMQLIQVIFCYLSWVPTESAAFGYWTPVISSWIIWNTSWFHWPRTSHQLQFSQLPNMEPLELLRLQPSEPNACESVDIKNSMHWVNYKINENQIQRDLENPKQCLSRQQAIYFNSNFIWSLMKLVSKDF